MCWNHCLRKKKVCQVWWYIPIIQATWRQEDQSAWATRWDPGSTRRGRREVGEEVGRRGWGEGRVVLHFCPSTLSLHSEVYELLVVISGYDLWLHSKWQCLLLPFPGCLCSFGNMITLVIWKETGGQEKGEASYPAFTVSCPKGGSPRESAFLRPIPQASPCVLVSQLLWNDTSCTLTNRLEQWESGWNRQFSPP